MNMFKMDFKRNFRSLLIWSLVSGAIMALFMMLYPSMMNSDFLALMNAKINSMPQALIDAFHMSGQDFTKLPQFFGYIVQFVLIAACIYGVILGMNTLSKEQSEGTIEFLYSKPVKRNEIVSAKLSSAVISYFVYFAIFSAAAIIASVAVKPPDLSLNDMVTTEKTILLGCMFAGFTYLFLGFAVAAFLKKGRHGASLAVAIFFILYILGAVPKMTGVLDFLKWVSPMNYFVMSDIVIHGIDWTNAAISLGIMAVCTALAYAVYSRKDFIV